MVVKSAKKGFEWWFTGLFLNSRFGSQIYIEFKITFRILKLTFHRNTEFWRCFENIMLFCVKRILFSY